MSKNHAGPALVLANVVIRVGLVALGVSFRSTMVHSMSSVSSTSLSSPTIHRVLAFGDSLTAGTSGDDLYPYASYLQNALQRRQVIDTVVQVRHRGLPGWTTQGMLDSLDDERLGLRTAIQAVTNPPLSLVILLAGTNDLANGAATAGQITQNLLRLHAVCHECGVVRTLAIGIPSSGYQAINADVATLVATVNSSLRHQIASQQERTCTTTFTTFPFRFVYQGENWNTDSLHLSPKGYQLLGESLAPVVEEILHSINID